MNDETRMSDYEIFVEAMALAQPRAKTLVEAVEMVKFLFQKEEHEETMD